jgi:MFS transporter, putative metabolite:H+ symporter
VFIGTVLNYSLATGLPTAFRCLGRWFLMAGVVYYFFGLGTQGKSLEQIDKELAAA